MFINVRTQSIFLHSTFDIHNMQKHTPSMSSQNMKIFLCVGKGLAFTKFIFKLVIPPFLFCMRAPVSTLLVHLSHLCKPTVVEAEDGVGG